jgi:hypothetical protein
MYGHPTDTLGRARLIAGDRLPGRFARAGPSAVGATAWTSRTPTRSPPSPSSRQLAAALEALPLDSVAEVLVLLEPTLEDLRRHAGLALERAPADRL